MADIDVVPKRRTNVWFWLIALVAIAVVVWLIVATFAPATSGQGGPGVVQEVWLLPPSPFVLS